MSESSGSYEDEVMAEIKRRRAEQAARDIAAAALAEQQRLERLAQQERQRQAAIKAHHEQMEARKNDARYKIRSEIALFTRNRLLKTALLFNKYGVKRDLNVHDVTSDAPKGLLYTLLGEDIWKLTEGRVYREFPAREVDEPTGYGGVEGNYHYLEPAHKEHVSTGGYALGRDGFLVDWEQITYPSLGSTQIIKRYKDGIVVDISEIDPTKSTAEQDIYKHWDQQIVNWAATRLGA